VTGELGESDAFLADAAQGELVEHAVGAVRLDQPLDRKQSGKQSGHPKRAGAGPRQQRPVRPDREREQRSDEQEEKDRQQRAAAGRRQPKLARDQGDHPSATSRASAIPSG
jgi:hypothetical protein